VRILYTVQRYGEAVVGGSEAATRAFAEHLVGRGHHVEVITSCAQSYVDWADVYEPGTEEINGVVVHRLPVLAPRTPEKFGPIHGWMITGPRPGPLFEQLRWAKYMGPDMAGYSAWVNDNVHRFDAAIFMTYMYSSTTCGLPAAAGRLPTVLQPTAHDEPPLWIRFYDTLFRLPDSFLYFTPEEREVIERRFRIDPAGEVIGIGIDLDEATDADEMRRRTGIGDDPYLLYVGRIDAIKGSRELFHFFETYKQRNDRPLKLMLVGESVSDLPPHPDVVFTGFLDEEQKRNAIAGAVALVQPSRFESFSIVVCESWVQRRPVLVHADSPVLVGQVRRSRGGVPYGGFAEFEAAVDLLLDEPALSDALGRNGREYVETNYRWDNVLDGVERALAVATERFARR
jgi:glycosyltransferase involved in cell wall biosynthesis